jgi:hypothetical protein
MSLGKLRFKLAQAVWWVQKKLDARKKPTDPQAAELVRYYNQSMGIFSQLGIDLNSKPAEVRPLYHMTLLYLDNEEVVCPAGARTASLIGFLDTTDAGWVLPPTSRPVTPELAKEVDGFFAVECFRNYRGLDDIRNEITEAIGRRSAELKRTLNQ